MQTQTNVVRFSSLNCVFTSVMVSRRLSSFSIISDKLAPFGKPPLAPRIPLSMGPNCVESWETFAKAFSRTEGNCKKRRVWPVGAVSKMMVSYERDFTCLRTSAKDIASSIPGIYDN